MHTRAPNVRPSSLHLSIFALALGLWAWPQSGHAAGSGERHFFAGVKGAYAQTYVDHHSSGHPGAGAFFEFTAIPHLLEIEFASYLFPLEHGQHIPLEILAKKPFHPTEDIQVFVGLGPLLSLSLADGHTSTHLGLTANTGAYFWLNQRFALSADVAYGLVLEEHAAHELVGRLGVVMGW